MKESMKNIFIVFGIGAAVVLIGCGSNKEAGSEGASLPAPPAATQHIDPATAATITGSVTFTGTRPVRKQIDMSANPACAKAHPLPQLSEDAVINDSGGVKNVFIWLKSGVPSGVWPVPANSATLDQKGCMYEPHVLGVMTYEDVKFTNSDSINHNIHPLPRTNQEWNESQPAGSPAIVKRFTRQEVMMPVKCNVHPWMRAFIGVVNHPFFAVTTADGTFKISGIPPGKYTIEAWQERYGVKDIDVTVSPKAQQAVNFEFTGTAR
jgi:plastocyanin